jgi:hypothetical protein
LGSYAEERSRSKKKSEENERVASKGDSRLVIAELYGQEANQDNGESA